MKLTPTQQAQLEVVKHQAEAHRDKKRTIDAKFEILKAQEIAASQYELDRQVRIAVTCGIPKKQIGEQGLGTKSPNTVYESLARTEEVAAVIAENEPEHVDRFSWSNDERTHIRISMAGAEWDEQRKEMEPNIRRNGDQNSGTFPLFEGQVIPRADSFDRTQQANGHKFDHPVTAWLLYYGGKEQAEAWIAAQGEAIAA